MVKSFKTKRKFKNQYPIKNLKKKLMLYHVGSNLGPQEWTTDERPQKYEMCEAAPTSVCKCKNARETHNMDV